MSRQLIGSDWLKGGGDMTTRTTLARVAAMGLSLLCSSRLASGQDCPELEGRWGYGPAYAVEASGTIAYLGSGSVLMVWTFRLLRHRQWLGT